MKLILEGWRSYQKEVLKEFLDMISHSAPYDEDGQPIDPDMTKAMEGFGREVNRNAQLRGLLFGLTAVADPTGVSGYEDFKIAKKAFMNKPTGASAGWLLLALLGSLPVAGALMAPVKLLKVKQALKSVSKIMPVLQKTAGNAELTKKVVQAQAKVSAAVNKADAHIALISKGKKAVAKAAPATARATGKVMKIQRTGAMYLSDGYSYVIVKTTDGPIAFYKSSGSGELATKDWLPFFGMNGKSQLMKLSGKHKDAAEFVARGRTAKGKYAVEGSEIYNVGKALDAQGAFKGVPNMFRGPADFLSNNIKGLTPGMPMGEIIDQLNRGLRKMGRNPMHPDVVEDIAINLHLRSNGVNLKLTSMAEKYGVPGITSMIDHDTLVQAIKLGI